MQLLCVLQLPIPEPAGRMQVSNSLQSACSCLYDPVVSACSKPSLMQRCHGNACRPDTFSLGVCNGCQLMALLGWVPGQLAEAPSASTNGASEAASASVLDDGAQPRFVHNASGRFESRWAHVTIQDSPSVLLKVGTSLPPVPSLDPTCLRGQHCRVSRYAATEHWDRA